MKKLKRWLAQFHPRFWIMNNPYNKEYDKKLNEMLDKYELEDVGRYTGKLGNKTLWLSNYPYSYGTLYEESLYGGMRASRMTILRLREKHLEVMTKEWE